MVKKTLIALLISASCLAEETTYDADSLRDRLRNGAQDKASAAERMKTARGDKSSLKILQDTDLNYKLPNGEYVRGMLLPNGTLSPAIKSRLGIQPACVTKNFELIKGVWDDKKESVVCNIPLSDLAYIDNSVRFESSATENKPADNKIVSNKYSTNKASEPVAQSQPAEPAAKPSPKQDDYVPAPRNKTNNAGRQTSNTGYVPAPRNNTGLNSKAGALISNNDEYGIPRGTWIKAELKRHTTSADSSDVEFIVAENIQGKFKTLEAGTILFASKSFNTSSKRLEALTSAAVTPAGNEVSGINAYVYSADQTPGLAGNVVRDREGEAVSIGKNSVLAAAANALPGTAGVATGVVSDISGELINNEQDSISTPRAYIEVSPQIVWLKTDKKI
jgi:hypothetical protein